MGASIKAIEFVYPKLKITNSDLEKCFPGYDFSKFEEKIGVKTRYWVGDNETALDLAVKACEKLFNRVDRTKIDFILLCTQSPEYFLPTTSCLLQEKLNLPKTIGALDFNLGCSGYVYGLSLAKALIESDQVKNVLLVTAETYSKYLNENDKSNRAIFGDAATATLISYSEGKGLMQFKFGTDGSGAESLIVKNGASRHNLDANAERKNYGSDNFYTDNDLYMDGPEIFNFTSTKIPSFTKDVLEANNIQSEELDYVVFHQANAYMLDLLRKKIKMSKDQFVINLEDGGNTVSNTIPIALKKLSDQHNFETTKKIAVVGFGVGLSWAGGVIELGKI